MRNYFSRKMQYHADLDVDEIFIDSFKLKNKDLKWEHRLEHVMSHTYARWVSALVIALLCFFGARIMYLHIAHGNELTKQAQENHIKTVWQKSPRGIIYDVEKRPLVSNASSFNLVAIPAELPKDIEEQEKVITLIQQVFKKDRAETLGLFENADRFSYQPIPLVSNITREELIELQGKIENVPGIRVEESFIRNYIHANYLSHVLGYIGLISEEERSQNYEYLLTDLVGKDGIEQQYDDYLHGSYGKTEYEINAQGREERELSTSNPLPGGNIVLYLDLELQKKITDVMQDTLNRKGLTGGAAVAIDPKSGGVLALQSFPTYDSNVFSKRLTQEDVDMLFRNETRPLYNRAIAGLYPPGSTIKPFIATGGLEEKVIDENTIIVSTEYISVGAQRFHDFRAYGPVNVVKALAVSSNVFFYTLGGGYGNQEGLGIDRIKQYLSKFNLAGPFGIDLPGESQGIIPDPEWKREERKEGWYIGDTYNTSIGQGFVSVSPLSLAMATASIANNGVLLKPRLLKAVANENLESIETTEIGIIDKSFVSQESLDIVRRGMRESVLSGYNQTLKDLPVSVAGKTGTAQNIPGKTEHSWYTVFAPYEDPEIVLTFIVEHGGLGTDTVVPIAKEVLRWYFEEYKPN